MSSRRPTAPKPRRPASRPASGPSSRRPKGPAREDRQRSRLGLVLPEVLTIRLLVLSVVVLLSFVLLLPTVRGAVQQQAELDRLRAELAAHEAERDRLTTELARWDDESYVVEQARTRLSYVMPGDTVWRVIDADEIPDPDEATDDEAPATETVAAFAAPGTPWYATMWGSVEAADRLVLEDAGQDGPGDAAAQRDEADMDPPASGGGQ